MALDEAIQRVLDTDVEALRADALLAMRMKRRLLQRSGKAAVVPFYIAVWSHTSLSQLRANSRAACLLVRSGEFKLAWRRQGERPVSYTIMDVALVPSTMKEEDLPRGWKACCMHFLMPVGPEHEEWQRLKPFVGEQLMP
ncbi:hypothetical protein HYH03_004897 [Edaphochlamys debaryana]|uniref:Uncharacterized protein n=1 Tax=Edaphochlamys debaryana TaxID=47281 RepID=A0A836BMP1_9CHLO|nr:hypothetical protein HYH03_018891 [Edaphochlamys debaryana]KAG2482165.1 hypothetical protein HYH03_018889 [Edaphochlamys debaryana]KAG2497314.1 hypothetical protein HYH03_004897 [Edaphochlamys debaryana]|eukprot:KAG2482155.1 hypothetical protein HYH03_018891 [Edaphochlamys debaryana]